MELLRKQQSVMIVEDDEKRRHELGDLLYSTGYQVLEKGSPIGALKTLEYEQPDLILIDVGLPEMSGLELCRRIKSMPSLRDIPVIFISSVFDGVQYKLDAFKAGGIDYVTKPINDQEVLARVDRHLAIRRLQRELLEANQRLEEQHKSLQTFFDPVLRKLMQEKPEELDARTRVITIAFWDVSGFSKWCDRVGPKVIVGFLRQYYKTATRIVREHGGVIDKFIGDGVMALFGFPGIGTSKDDGAADAVRTGLLFRKEFNLIVDQAMKERSKSTTLKPAQITLRCGIHTGEVFVGRMGTEPDQFTGFGGEVNVASRIESSCEGKQLVRISSTTKERLDGTFQVSEAVTITMKNIDGEHIVYDVAEPREHGQQRSTTSSPGTGRAHVFVCYCRENRSEVERLREELIHAGEAVWWDGDILPGQDWREQIRFAMEIAYAVALCLSKETAERITSGIYPEIRDAIGSYREHAPGSIFLIPVRLSQCKIPPIEIDATRTLDRLQWVDLFPAEHRAAGLRELLRAIRAAPHHPGRRGNAESSSVL